MMAVPRQHPTLFMCPKVIKIFNFHRQQHCGLKIRWNLWAPLCSPSIRWHPCRPWTLHLVQKTMVTSATIQWIRMIRIVMLIVVTKKSVWSHPVKVKPRSKEKEGHGCKTILPRLCMPSLGQIPVRLRVERMERKRSRKRLFNLEKNKRVSR